MQFTLGADCAVKVWDLRNYRCLQTVTEVSALFVWEG